MELNYRTREKIFEQKGDIILMVFQHLTSVRPSQAQWLKVDKTKAINSTSSRHVYS